MRLSVIIPTYNPNLNRLNLTLASLKIQQLPLPQWELIIIDNNSSNNFGKLIDLTWHPSARIVKEDRPGLTHARMKGFREARTAIIVMVDDDNVLDNNYLEEVLNIFDKQSELGAMGGKSIALFEDRPPVWLPEFYENLAVRDLGDEIIISKWNFMYPVAAPIGAGMAVRRAALDQYVNKLLTQENVITDRIGTSLSSGGDNDIILEIVKAGWLVGYFPALLLQHIIPKQRMQTQYLAQLVNNSNRSWIRLLENHGINPWPKIAPWTLPFRKVKAWFVHKAWLKPVNYIKWQGACGIFEGLAEID